MARMCTDNTELICLVSDVCEHLYNPHPPWEFKENPTRTNVSYSTAALHACAINRALVTIIGRRRREGHT